MKKTNFLLMIAAFFVFTGCNKYDDEIDQLNQDITSVDSEVQLLAQQLLALQNWQTQVNTDIQSLKTIVAALEKKDYVTSVEPTADGTGYVITFQNSGTVTIRHGKDGETPDISVKQAEDGLYYWMVDGDWLTDAAGKKIPTTGEDGKDGADAIAPQVRISSTTNLWEISTDGGSTWTSTGVRATGPKGDKGDTGASGSDGDDGSHGDSFFKDVEVFSESVVFTLSDNTKFTLPLYVNLNIQSLTYIPTHDDGKATMTYNGNSGEWEAELSFFVTPKSVIEKISEGHISVKGVYTASRSVDLKEGFGVLLVDTENAKNGIITVKISTDDISLNQDMAVFLIIKSGDSEFVSDYVPLTLKTSGDINATNMSADELEGVVTQALNDGVRNFTITDNLDAGQQYAIGTALFDWCNGYYGNDEGKGTVFLTLPDVKIIYSDVFGAEGFLLALKSVSAPEATEVGNHSFYKCGELTQMNLPKVTTVGDFAFADCKKLTTLSLGSPITEWGYQVLNNMTTENITLYLHKDQKVLSDDDSNGVWTIAGSASGVEFETGKIFCGYTFKEIKKYGE